MSIARSKALFRLFAPRVAGLRGRLVATGAAGLVLVCLLAFAHTAAAKKQVAADAAPMIWPPPPDEPRIALVQSITGPSDFGIRSSVWNRLANLAAGSERDGQKLAKPFGVALDEDDNLCLTDTGSGRVWFFDRSRKRVRSWTKAGAFAFASPVAVAKRKGVFYVADSSAGKVVLFNEKGRLIRTVQQELSRPAGLAASDSRLFVADSAAHCVAVFDLEGNYLSKFGKRGAGAGELNFPTHIALDSQGNLLVTDSMNSRIQLYDATGRFLGVIGSAGDGSGHFSRPKGVASDAFGHVYVVDAIFDNFQIFDREGRFLLSVGRPGAGPGEFWLPGGIAIGRDHRIYVADGCNGRVQVFQYLAKK